MTKWNQAKLEELKCQKVEENAFLEYKAADALHKSVGKKKEIAKDVSAMANSAGGIIIYGISEYQQNDKKHLPEKYDPVDRTEYPKEWLDQIINYNISPKIDGLIIHSIDLDSGPNDVAYVVEIPQSMTAHQVTTDNDYRYYERANFEVVRMPDHRIRDVMNRGVAPNADVEFAYQIQQNRMNLLIIKIVNMGKQLIRYIKLDFSFPNLDNIPVMEGNSRDRSGKVNINAHQPECLLNKQEYKYDIQYYSDKVLFPKDTMDITDIVKLQYRIDNVPHKAKCLEWALYADSMYPKSGKINIYSLKETAN